MNKDQQLIWEAHLNREGILQNIGTGIGTAMKHAKKLPGAISKGVGEIKAGYQQGVKDDEEQNAGNGGQAPENKPGILSKAVTGVQKGISNFSQGMSGDKEAKGIAGTLGKFVGGVAGQEMKAAGPTLDRKSTDKNWVSRGGQSFGPYNASTIESWLKDQKLSPMDKVYIPGAGGKGEWANLEDVKFVDGEGEVETPGAPSFEAGQTVTVQTKKGPQQGVVAGGESVEGTTRVTVNGATYAVKTDDITMDDKSTSQRSEINPTNPDSTGTTRSASGNRFEENSILNRPGWVHKNIS